MVKRHYSNTDILYIYGHIKEACESGNLRLAQTAKFKLRHIWDSFNDGQTDIDDIDLLYRKLKSAVKLTTALEAKRYAASRP